MVKKSAKSKGLGKSSPIPMYEAGPPTMHLDCDVSQLKKLKLGEKVTAHIEGTVKEISLPYKDSSRPNIGHVTVFVTKKSVEGKNAYSEMAEDEDDYKHGE